MTWVIGVGIVLRISARAFRRSIGSYSLHKAKLVFAKSKASLPRKWGEAWPSGVDVIEVIDKWATTDRGNDQCGQATKGMWGMSGRQQAMKGVEDCDKPGEVVKRALIPGCPNDHAPNP